MHFCVTPVPTIGRAFVGDPGESRAAPPLFAAD